MPFIAIKSLPLSPPKDIAAILKGLSEDFSADTGIAMQHITTTWEYLQPMHYVVAGKAAPTQPAKTHPVLVDVLAPDFNKEDMITKMLESVATHLARHAQLPHNNIFINIRLAHSGKVLDAGEIVRW